MRIASIYSGTKDEIQLIYYVVATSSKITMNNLSESGYCYKTIERIDANDKDTGTHTHTDTLTHTRKKNVHRVLVFACKTSLMLMTVNFSIVILMHQFGLVCSRPLLWMLTQEICGSCWVRINYCCLCWTDVLMEIAERRCTASFANRNADHFCFIDITIALFHPKYSLFRLDCYRIIRCPE